jgi:hypothetical protein
VDESRIDDLFRLPPEEFTPARDQLAREATEAGDREGAKAIKALRRPTVAAWAVNAAVHRQPELVAGLLETAARLRTAQRRAASGVAAQDFREASAERRRLVRLLTEEAQAVLAEAGRAADQHVAAAGRTFETAASEESAAEAVRAGRLSKELSPSSGFDVIDAFAVIPGAAEPEPEAPKEDRATTAARRQLATARREIERQTRRAATAREELRSAEREASDADQAARALEHDLDRARRRADEAHRQVDRASAKAERAVRALEEAEAKAAEIEGGGATGAR